MIDHRLSGQPGRVLTAAGSPLAALRALVRRAPGATFAAGTALALGLVGARYAIERRRRRAAVQCGPLPAVGEPCPCGGRRGAEAKAILERITEAFFALDREWRLVYLNPAARRLVEMLIGRKPGEVLGRDFWEVVPEIRGTPLEAAYRQAMERQQPTHFEEPVSAWGAWFEVHAYPSPEGLSVFFMDITQRKRNERDLTLLAEAGAVLSSSLDHEATLAAAARVAASRLCDYAAIHLVEGDGVRGVAAARRSSCPGPGGSASAGRAPEVEDAPAPPPPAPGSSWLAPLRTGEPLLLEWLGDAELEALAAESAQRGLLREVGVRSALVLPLRSRGNTLGVLALMSGRERRLVARDLPVARELARCMAAVVENARLFREAERHAREQAALREAAEAVAAPMSIEAMVEQIAAGALTATGADGAFVARIDAETSEVVTAATAGVRGPSVGSRVPFARSLAERALHGNTPLTIPRLDAVERPLLRGLGGRCGECGAIVVPLAEGEHAIGVLVLLREPGRPAFGEDEVRRAHTFGQLAALAFRKVQLLAEAERRHDELERVMESRARLMRGFSHDLKNPLGAADGYAQLLEEGLIQDADKQRESVGRIRTSIGSALRLIEDLLELTRVEAGQLESRNDPVDVAAVVREVADDYRAQAAAAGLEIVVDDTASPAPVIGTDQHRVRQVLGNLVSNAVKYTPRGGRIGILAGVRSREGFSPAVAVDVWDTGPGIEPDRREEIFHEFTRLHPDSADGAGLGLAISRRIARALGGDLTVADGPDRVGARFTLWLPLERRAGADRRAGGPRAA